ncbi:15-hydroxyprostaglandin dehydrogenase [NAD(+)] [Lachnellula hyalina]|uniref:15-hydroxyprostaglandin dehydrogenase [NAD(+)] n=1 Tax=Lachnellula hyalina TaxID=1316788 RepID=A0A8H8QZK0_9HELO|nr:15-hydroxyprostaglandin dehydrogenase [NAD(+)] [Lachnellula hyalina]TVY25634.1 15-hydroxyprostaglandin dehydrogenase [NAD(+)] [Lachnellula hyalina]
MSKKLAIITGAASGLGLALTKHLLSQNWRVCMADTNATIGDQLASELGDDVLFIPTDVSIYSQQANLFAKAFEFGGQRLDFAALNAGIDDKQSLYSTKEELDERGGPKELNLVTLKVDLDAVVQGIWLFKYYARRNADKKGGKIVITSSAAGLYPMDTNPLYTAAKHALVGLTRACGPRFMAEDSITVNCICPAFVPTGLCPPHVLHLFPKEHITPMSTVLRAHDTFLADDTMSGKVVELSLDQLYYREQPDWANDSQRWLGTESKSLWDEAYLSGS